VTLTLNFNFNLHADSSIALNRDGKPVALGAKPIASNQLAITAPVSESNAPDGVYTVNYKACWPDRSCHEGSVSFVVDSTARSSFIDLRGRS
jgi:methionine-rich copper-binding protein CopC